MKKIALFVLVLVILGGGGYFLKPYFSSGSVQTYKTPEEKDVYVRFDMEAFDKIRANYWASTTEQTLANHFQLSLQKVLNTPVVPPLQTADRTGVAKMIAAAMNSATSTDAKKQIALNTLVVALYNLQPIGRNALYSAKDETALRQNVSNVNPSNDLYKDLGVDKTATASQIAQAYSAKAKTLENSTSTDAKAELKQIAHAKDVLSDPNTRDLYDYAKIEPTMSHQVYGKTLYIDMSKVSPTSFLEFGRTIIAASTTPGLDSLILDLRGNIGGSLDFAQNFLGLFLGNNQYAFDLFHQGDLNVQRTVQDKFSLLDRYKEIALLTDNMTQSTAEVTTAAMKRFKLAYVVGDTTRGWGTVENTFPLTTVIDPAEKYSLFLVHSLTIRDDGLPIEGNGVTPNVSIKDSTWKSELSNYFKSPSLIEALKSIAAKPLQK